MRIGGCSNSFSRRSLLDLVLNEIVRIASLSSWDFELLTNAATSNCLFGTLVLRAVMKFFQSSSIFAPSPFEGGTALNGLVGGVLKEGGCVTRRGLGVGCGGIACGVERLVMLLADEENIRETMVFPKTQSGSDMLFGSPSPVDESQLKELGLQVVRESKTISHDMP
mgnify:CR=1 FL=1